MCNLSEPNYRCTYHPQSHDYDFYCSQVAQTFGGEKPVAMATNTYGKPLGSLKDTLKLDMALLHGAAFMVS